MTPEEARHEVNAHAIYRAQELREYAYEVAQWPTDYRDAAAEYNRLVEALEIVMPGNTWDRLPAEKGA